MSCHTRHRPHSSGDQAVRCFAWPAGYLSGPGGMWSKMNAMRSWLTISSGDVKRPTPTTGGFRLTSCERLFEIRDQVLYVLDPDGQAHKILRNRATFALD